MEKEISNLENMIGEIYTRIRELGVSNTTELLSLKEIVEGILYKAIKLSSYGNAMGQITINLLKEKGVITDEDVRSKLDDKCYLEELKKQQSEIIDMKDVDRIGIILSDD